MGTRVAGVKLVSISWVHKARAYCGVREFKERYGFLCISSLTIERACVGFMHNIRACSALTRRGKAMRRRVGTHVRSGLSLLIRLQ